MRYLLFFLLAIVPVAPVPAQEGGESGAAVSPGREALLRAAVTRDRGTITALEPHPAGAGGVVVGHASGAVLNCYGEDRCTEFSGTPAAAVERIAVSRAGDGAVIWVTYPYGALYRCEEDSCSRFIWDTSGR